MAADLDALALHLSGRSVRVRRRLRLVVAASAALASAAAHAHVPTAGAAIDWWPIEPWVVALLALAAALYAVGIARIWRHATTGRAVHARHARLPQKPNVFPGLGPRLKRGAEVAILVHEAERLLVVGVEVQRARGKTVGDCDPPDRASGLRKMVGDPDRLKHAH